ncbi:MAG: putative metal-dependent phosphohydrolase [uncultured marine phage]|uniref:Putative metal-dependent phosphohydrolase n=1 Tax=uncultured marine phage TaxID=707152 RepID=A0A8D9C9L6_9VIRU|nr:MAG: putative metal-dependent phosphohydrolase [uncultured marine phage]
MKLDIIKTEDIYIKAFKYIANNSESNTLPYHNIDHLVMVFNNAYSASQHYKLDEVLGETATKELCVASLFHDSNHSGGKLSDPENVNNSIKLFEEFFTQYIGDKLSDDDVKFKETVINILSATEFPHKEGELTIQQRIIRDCDMMSVLQDNYLYSVIFGLREEFGVDTIKEQIKNQTLFTMNLKMFTEWGEARISEKYGHLMNDLSVLTNIFKDDNYEKEESPIVDMDDDFMIVNGKKMAISSKKYVKAN